MKKLMLGVLILGSAHSFSSNIDNKTADCLYTYSQYRSGWEHEAVLKNVEEHIVAEMEKRGCVRTDDVIEADYNLMTAGEYQEWDEGRARYYNYIQDGYLETSRSIFGASAKYKRGRKGKGKEEVVNDYLLDSQTFAKAYVAQVMKHAKNRDIFSYQQPSDLRRVVPNFGESYFTYTGETKTSSGKFIRLSENCALVGVQKIKNNDRIRLGKGKLDGGRKLVCHSVYDEHPYYLPEVYGWIEKNYLYSSCKTNSSTLKDAIKMKRYKFETRSKPEEQATLICSGLSNVGDFVDKVSEFGELLEKKMLNN